MPQDRISTLKEKKRKKKKILHATWLVFFKSLSVVDSSEFTFRCFLRDKELIQILSLIWNLTLGYRQRMFRGIYGNRLKTVRERGGADIAANPK